MGKSQINQKENNTCNRSISPRPADHSSTNRNKRQDFLLRELARRDRTVAETPDLYAYIQSDRTDLDQTRC